MNKTTHCLSLHDHTDDTIHAILKRATHILAAKEHYQPIRTTLTGKTLASLFFENSTRTRASFELAHTRCNGAVLQLPLAQSSLEKGETILDMFLTLQAMHVNVFVVRHADPACIHTLAEHAAPGVHLINAGSGTAEHPSQALLDLLTISQHHADLSNVSVAIVGDVLHSRVARSDIALFQRMGITDIRLAGPANLMPTPLPPGVRYCDSVVDAITGCDVVITLRIQLERMSGSLKPDPKAYHQQFGLTEKIFTHAAKNAILMHPGPIQRDVELSDSLANSAHARILQQVENGVAVRMALLEIITSA